MSSTSNRGRTRGRRQSPVTVNSFEPSALESQSSFISATPTATDNDSDSVVSVSSSLSKTPYMISSDEFPRYKKSNKKRRKKKSKVRTRPTSAPKVVRARTYQSSYDNNGHRRRESKLTRRNVQTHNKDQAVRPPSNLHLFQKSISVAQTFRTPQPKLRPKSRKMSRRNSQCSTASNKSGKSTKSERAKHISVAIRLRPLNDGERQLGMKAIWSVKDNTTLKQIRGTISSYNFEYVCPGITDPVEGTTLNLYNAVSKRVVLSSCKGVNGTIFAYGQTSSGKTYTMLGTDTDPGITLLALSDIFHFIRNDVNRKYALFISYIEIHNEVINDLLNGQNTNLRIVDTPDQGPVVKNCTEQAVKTPQDVVQCLLRGEKLRKVSETHSNLRSSRSHAIFRIFIQSQSRNDKSKGHKTLGSVLNLVDLAGSESSSNIDNHNTGQIKEAKHINQSLLCLGRVILALSSKKHKSKNTGYVPYRDSKLTRILQPSLGGNANTAVICTMSPCTNCLEESANTLRFAQFTSKVKNHARINETMDDKSQLKKYQNLVKSLKRQIKVFTAKSTKIHAVFDKMKKLKKQNASLQTKIKHQQKSKQEMVQRLNFLQDQVASCAESPAPSVQSTRSYSIPTKPATPPTESARFHRRRLFVSTAKDGDSHSEPDYTQMTPTKTYQISISADEPDRGSECGSHQSETRSLGTPSTITSTVEFQRVILNLQDKLEEVQGNIETLTHRIATAQFVDINSMVAPSPKQDIKSVDGDLLSVGGIESRLKPLVLAASADEIIKSQPLDGQFDDVSTQFEHRQDTLDTEDVVQVSLEEELTRPTDSEEIEVTEVVEESQQQVQEEEEKTESVPTELENNELLTVDADVRDDESHFEPSPVLQIQRDTESDIPVIRLVLNDDETPDLPQEKTTCAPSEMSESQAHIPHISDLHKNSMSQDIVVFKSLEDEIMPFGCTFTEKVDFWKDQLETEREQTDQLLRMISGTRAMMVQTASGDVHEVRLWLQVQHVGVGNGRPVYMICWKRITPTFNSEPTAELLHDDYSESASAMNANGRRNSRTISLAQLNSTFTKSSTLLLTSVNSILHGQATQTFKKAKTTFSDNDLQLSCSFMTSKRSIDLVFPDEMQYEAWTQCLDTLLRDQQYRNSTLHSFANSMMQSRDQSRLTSKAGSLEPTSDMMKLYTFNDAMQTRASAQITPAESLAPSEMGNNNDRRSRSQSMDRTSYRQGSVSLDIRSMPLDPIDSEQSSMRLLSVGKGNDTRASKPVSEVVPVMAQSVDASDSFLSGGMSFRESVGTAVLERVKNNDLILPEEPERRISGVGELPRFGHGTGSVSRATSMNTSIVGNVLDDYYDEMASAFMTPTKVSWDMYGKQGEQSESIEDQEESKMDHEKEGGDQALRSPPVIQQDINNTILSLLMTDDERENDESVNPPQLNVM